MKLVAELGELGDPSVQVGGPGLDEVQYMRAWWAALVSESDDALDLPERETDGLGGTDEPQPASTASG